MSDECNEDSPTTRRRGADTAATRAQAQGASPAAPRVTARLYACANPQLRVRLLSCLLRPLSPLGIVAVAGGAFAGMWHREGVRIAIDEAARFTSAQVVELAQFVEQAEPSALEQFATLAAANPASLTTFGAAAIVLLVRALRKPETATIGIPVHATAERLSSTSR